MKTSRIILECDGKSIPMNSFVRKIFISTILGMIGSLNKVKDNPRQIQIMIEREVKG